MNLDELRQLVTAAEPALASAPFVIAATFERDGRPLDLALTERLRKACKRGRVWAQKPFLTALKNAGYGFDLRKAMSPGGQDGIYLVTREYRPANEMMRKLFDRYLDRPDGDAAALCHALGTTPSALLAVRLVSHHLRLLGVLHRTTDRDLLVLVDYDDSE